MVEITIIDDSEEMRDLIHQVVEDTLEGMEIKVLLYENGPAFLETLDKWHRPDIILCDIEMPGLDGIGVGRQIRKDYPQIYLVYLTSHSEYAMQSYELDAYQYVLKDQIKDRLPRILQTLATKVDGEKSKFRMIGTNTRQEKVYYRDIITIEKEKGSKYIKFNTALGEFRERTGLEQILKEMNTTIFFQTDRGRAVNIKHIARVKKDSFLLDNGEEIILNRKNMQKLKEYIHENWRNN